ncbi:hypothetical protein [Lysobacter fragariae]
MRLVACTLLLCASGTVLAGNNADIAEFVPDGMAVESRLDADLTGDGRPEAIFIATGEETRVCTVLGRFQVDAAPGQKAYEVLSPIDSLALELSPLGSGSLSAKKGVLMLEDLTGGTTATQTTYRFRFDASEDRMRLIGLDTERYSRTNSHGSIKLSWNLLNGAHIVQQGDLDESGQGDGAYRYRPEQKTVHKSEKVFMSDTPNPDDLIDAEIVPEGEDRN